MLARIKRYLGWTVYARFDGGKKTYTHTTWFRKGALEWAACYPAGCVVRLVADGGTIFERRDA